MKGSESVELLKTEFFGWKWKSRSPRFADGVPVIYVLEGNWKETDVAFMQCGEGIKWNNKCHMQSL